MTIRCAALFYFSTTSYIYGLFVPPIRGKELERKQVETHVELLCVLPYVVVVVCWISTLYGKRRGKASRRALLRCKHCRGNALVAVPHSLPPTSNDILFFVTVCIALVYMSWYERDVTSLLPPLACCFACCSCCPAAPCRKLVNISFHRYNNTYCIYKALALYAYIMVFNSNCAKEIQGLDCYATDHFVHALPYSWHYTFFSIQIYTCDAFY